MSRSIHGARLAKTLLVTGTVALFSLMHLAASAAEPKPTRFRNVTAVALPQPFVPATNVDASPVVFPAFFKAIGGVIGAPICGAFGSAPCHFGQSAYIGGVIIADFNGDGRNDIFATNAAGGGNKLYLNHGNNRDGVAIFKEVAAEAGVAFPDDQSAAAVAGDINNDGLVDLYISVVGFDPELELKRSNPALGLKKGDLDSAATRNKGYNHLMINKGFKHGKWLGFEDATERARVSGEPSTRSTTSAFVDFDRDGALDLFVGAHTNVFLVPTPSDFPFPFPGPLSKRVANPECLFEGGVIGGTPKVDLSGCTPQGGPLLFRSRLAESGQLVFDDVTKLLREAIDTATGRPNVGHDGRPFIDSFMTFDRVWFDYDNDGYPDLVTANDAGVIGIYRNVGGKRFEFVSKTLLIDPEKTLFQGLDVGAVGAWMSISHGDVNGDGLIDFYATNVGSGGVDGTAFTQPRHALYINRINERGQHEFVDVASQVARDERFRPFPAASLANPASDDGTDVVQSDRGHFAFGGQLFDMNNDGSLDVVNIGNLFGSGVGTRKADPNGAAPFAFTGTENFRVTNRGTLFKHQGRNETKLVAGRSVEVPVMVNLTETQAGRAATGIDNPFDGRGLAIGDLNGDGYLDIVAVNVSGHAVSNFDPFASVIGPYNGSVVIFQNRGVNDNKSLVLRLEGTRSNRSGIGARVSVKPLGGGRSDRTIVRELSSNIGHRGNASLDLLIGVGDADSVSFTINWPSGTRQTFSGVQLHGTRNCFQVVEASVSGERRGRDKSAPRQCDVDGREHHAGRDRDSRD